LGALNAPLHPSSARAVANWIPAPKRGAANGLAVSAAALGIAGTYYLFGSLIDWVDWPGAFLITGAATALVGLVWLVVAGDEPARRRATLVRSTSPEASAHWSRLFLHRGLALLTLSYAAVNYFEYIFFYWMIYYFGTVLTLGSERSRFYSTIVGLAMAVGMLSGGVVTDRLERALGYRQGRAAVPIAGMLTGALMLGLGVLAANPLWVVLWFSLALGSVTSAEASFWLTAVELGRSKGTTAAGILNTGGNVGGLLAPMVTPWVGITFGWPWAMTLGAIVIFVGAFVWIWILPPDETTSPKIEPVSTSVPEA
jgi:MFS family permease